MHLSDRNAWSSRGNAVRIQHLLLAGERKHVCSVRRSIVDALKQEALVVEVLGPAAKALAVVMACAAQCMVQDSLEPSNHCNQRRGNHTAVTLTTCNLLAITCQYILPSNAIK